MNQYLKRSVRDVQLAIDTQFKACEENKSTVTCAIIYHKNCNDGITSAAVVKHFVETKIEQTERNMKIFSTPMNYGQDLDPLFEEQVYDLIFIVDFSLDAELLEDMASKHKCVIVLDHHASPIKKIGEYYETHNVPQNLLLVLTQEKGMSGANLCWEYLCPDQAVPSLVADVADRDTWLFNRPNSKATHRGLLLLKEKRSPVYIQHTFIEGHNPEAQYQELVVAGSHAEAMWQHTIEELSKAKVFTSLLVEGKEIPCCLINCPYMFASDLADYIMHQPHYEKDMICIIFNVYKTNVGLSLRSVNGTAGSVAESLGGGGHPNAGGAGLQLEDLPSRFKCFE